MIRRFISNSSLTRGKKFLITGSTGQIGQRLIPYLHTRFGSESVVASDLEHFHFETSTQPEFYYLDVTKKDEFLSVAKEVKPTHLIHLAAFNSAKAEDSPQQSLEEDMSKVNNALEVARQVGCSIYIPSSIASFGPSSPRVDTPEDCALQPTTIYGVSTVYLELIGNYYQQKFGVDFRSLRYPGTISSDLPGSKTTDYAVEIFFEALKHNQYQCFLSQNTMLPMIHIHDLIKGTVNFIMAPEEKLTRRVYNIGAISFTPYEIAEEIAEHLPSFKISYKPDHRQAYADSWPMNIDDSNARKDWGWRHEYDLEDLVDNMLIEVRNNIQKPSHSPKHKRVDVIKQS